MPGVFIRQVYRAPRPEQPRGVQPGGVRWPAGPVLPPAARGQRSPDDGQLSFQVISKFVVQLLECCF
jgi:hypothetical protein